MKRRTLSLKDLQTLAVVCHKYDAIHWPPRDEGGWATATLNGHPYRARVAPVSHQARVFTDSDYADGTVFWGWECSTCGPHDARFTSADAAQEVGDDHEATV